MSPRRNYTTSRPRPRDPNPEQLDHLAGELNSKRWAKANQQQRAAKKEATR